MELKHTPGPWSLRISDKSWQNRYQIQRSDGACLFSFEDSPLHDDAEADGRLIAAAPRLLAACEKFLDAMRTSGASNGAIRAAEDDARSAIASALGKE